MKVTVLQTDVQWAKPQYNVNNVNKLIEANTGSDLYVLPEMWATGFATAPHGIAEGANSVALRWMQHTAKKYHCAVSGSLLVNTKDHGFRNRHFFVTPEKTAYYDKHHLFTYGHEDEYIRPGNSNVVVSWQGYHFLLLTCYDLRFPVWARYGRAGFYDAIIIVANWPESRQQAWRILTRARAIENQCFLIGCNRVGDDNYCHYRGESLICNSKGDTLAEATPDKQQAFTVTLDFEQLHNVRKRFKVLEDRDREI